MRRPPDDRVPAQGARRDSSPHQGDLEDLALQRNPQVQQAAGIGDWAAFATWLRAVTS